MQAHEDEKGPKRRQARRLGPREVFFFSFSVLLTMKAHSSPRRPTQANEGQCRPTKTKKGPNDARRVAWAPGKFFCSFSVLLTTKAHSSPRRPTQAHEDEKGPKRRQARRLGPR